MGPVEWERISVNENVSASGAEHHHGGRLMGERQEQRQLTALRKPLNAMRMRWCDEPMPDSCCEAPTSR